MDEATRTRTRRQGAGAAARGRGEPALLLLHSDSGAPPCSLVPLASRTVIGRGAGGGPALRDAEVSRRHAAITVSPDGFAVEDLGSRNGTFLDGRRVQGCARCAPGALVRLGGHLFALVADAAAWRGLSPARGPRVGGPALRAAEAAVVEVARDRLPILIEGESGAGKELLAELAHAESGRAGAFVPVNCAAVPAGLAEATLFGHRRGAFTGALADAPGLARAADGGTLFLDEVGEMPPPLQAKLLRLVERGELTPVGAGRPERVDARIVAATHRDLRGAAESGSFRLDLFFRLAGARVRLPPLRERREDVALLAEHVRREAAPGIAFTVEAVERLCLHAWPGNVRELAAAVRWLLLRARAGRRARVTAAEVDERLGADAGDAGGAGDDEARALRALRAHGGNVVAAARAAGLPRRRLYRILARLGRTPAEFRGPE